jgi:hypothetical protein
MTNELLKPVMNAIFALLLLFLIKIVAMFMLKEVYSLWKILYNNSEKLPDIFRNVLHEEIIKCSCGWKNQVYAKFCLKCGSNLMKEAKYL